MKAIAERMKPPPRLTVSQWADEYRFLSPEASAEPGKWVTARAEYQRGIMDAVSDPSIHTVVLMIASQSGKTELLNNICGFHIHQDAAPILLVQPTLEMAETWSKDRLAPMLRDTPCLTGKVKDPRTRDSGNTLRHKVFPGGHITVCGANSPASLASRPIRIVLCDEVDRYPASAGTEGDPVLLASRRAATFWNKKIVLVSTPTIKGHSRIEQAYFTGDQRRYYVPCAHCGEKQLMRWQNVKWPDGEPEKAAYHCEHCGVEWSEINRAHSLSKGEWVAEAESKGVASFYLSGLYSPWIGIAEAAAQFMQARAMPETLKTWVNTYLGETWEDAGERVDDIGLYERREPYETCPDDVLLITAGCDVQDDRVEIEYVGWGRQEESWSLDYKVIYGDPANPDFWGEVDKALSVTFPCAGGELRIAASFIDSGGHHTQSVYKFCKSREGKRIFACKGHGGEGKPLVNRPTLNNSGKVKLFMVGVDTAKELIHARLRIEDFGAGYCHFPERYDGEYFRQLTAEQIVVKHYKGFARREWQKIRPRNEALDCRVYALAAFTMLNANTEIMAQRRARPAIEQPKQQPKEEPPVKRKQARQPRRRTGAWASNW